MFVMAFLSTMMLLSVCVCVCVCAWLSLGNTHCQLYQVLAFRSDTVCEQSNVYKQPGLT